MRKSGGLAHWCGALRIFMFSQSRHELCCQPLPSPHTQYCICTRWRMMKAPGGGMVAGQKLILALFDHFIFTSRQGYFQNEHNEPGLLHISYTQAFTSLLGIYMESGNWFEMIWTGTSSVAGHPGLSLSSFLIIKCKSLAGLRGFSTLWSVLLRLLAEPKWTPVAVACCSDITGDI